MKRNWRMAWWVFGLSLAWCVALTGGEVWLTPLARAVSGEPFPLWWSWRGEAPSGAGETWRWRVVEAEDVVRPELSEEWRPLEGCGGDDVTLSLAVAEGQPTGRLTVAVERRGAEATVSELGRLSLEVVSGASLDARTRCRLRREQAVMRGLRWLQTRQREDGRWGESREVVFVMGGVEERSSDHYNEAATTAFALWAFGSHGFGLSGGREHPFSATVSRGLDYLLGLGLEVAVDSVSPDDWEQPDGQMGWWLDDPSLFPALYPDGSGSDLNANGRLLVLGGRSNVENYVHPICLSALVAAGYPERVCRLPSGRTVTLREAVEDARDFTVWQLDKGNAWYQGWGYCFVRHVSGFDLSIGGWNFLGLEAARAWGMTLDRTLCRELMGYLSDSYDCSNDFFLYEKYYAGATTVSLNASGLLGMSLLQDAWPDSGFRLKGFQDASATTHPES